ncbi:hypothetical protein N7540_013117 [Penicillium herquei]|nr:hypothetical protein N7540_013117 [Penicillium herquei]
MTQVSTNAKDTKGYGPLYLAVIDDDLAAVRIPLEHLRVDVNSLTTARGSVLIQTAKTLDSNRGSSQILRDIVSIPDVLLDQRDRMGSSAFWPTQATFCS